ncbi:MAG: hypothetical protein WKF96_00070 [Solirubrobacteraceae bacterium]
MQKNKQVGVSPKVLIPVIGQILVGVVLLLFGLDVEGRTALAAAFGTAVLGAGAGPGEVTSDDLEAG